MFKKHMTPLQPHTKKGSLHSHVGKGAMESQLPQRGALNTLVGSPQSPNNYAKATPMTAGPTNDGGDATAPMPGGY
jgi:hypothetical protein